MRKRSNKSSGGFTLLELTIALALWMILSAGVFFLWQYAANAGTDMLEQQYAFENARITMDALLMNLQKEHTVRVRNHVIGGREISHSIVFCSRGSACAEGAWQQQCANPGYVCGVDDCGYHFRFQFVPGPEIVTVGRFRDGRNTFASHIPEVRLEYLDERMRVTVRAVCHEPNAPERGDCRRWCYEPHTLVGSVCMRGKYVEER